ncbi:Tetratricopeptide repeat-containing protein [Catalinimonas alkaloidigena]|uniref:Tetratricopeptide repeat-containing protein n=1 Tax=Catalinimonas alkaloidigena TaxID=1075417 RepID=A0A1G9IQ27_9BACT|nr:tetratricopeptide repeat protein [Catalinimonas alkaloidigena]SDL27063.1 Tetratricopeptide repeat-containing protein [Catalinimonas alkaloidigena]
MNSLVVWTRLLCILCGLGSLSVRVQAQLVTKEAPVLARVEHLQTTSDHEAALRLLRDYLPTVSPQDTLQLTEVYHHIALSHWYLSQYYDALRYYEKAFALDRALNHRRNMALRLNNIGLVHWRLGQCDMAIENFTASARMAQAEHDERLLGVNYLNLGLLWKNQRDLPKAYAFNQQAIALLTRTHDDKNLANAFNNRGQTFKIEARYDSAEYYYRAAHRLRERLGDREGMATSLNNLSEIYFHTQRLPEAFDAVHYSLALSEEIHNHLRIKEALANLSEYHEQTGQLDSALYYHKAYEALSDSLHAQTQTSEVAFYQAHLGSELKELKIRDLQAAQASMQTRVWWGVAVLLGGLLAGVWVGRWRWRTVQRERRQAEQQLVQARQQLTAREQELKEYVITLSTQRSLIHSLEEALTQRRPAPEAVPVAEVDELLQRKILTDEDWELYKAKFQSIYPGFFSQLKLSKVAFTEAEVRYMVLFKLNLTSREMADLLGISPQSVRVSKLRLKKKLQRHQYDSVETFLEEALC